MQEIKKWIEELYAFGPRRAGSPIGHEVEDYVEEQFKSVGLEKVSRQSIPLTYWDCTAHSLRVDEEKISASFKIGILNVSLPKHENILPKEREIKVS